VRSVFLPTTLSGQAVSKAACTTVIETVIVTSRLYNTEFGTIKCLFGRACVHVTDGTQARVHIKSFQVFSFLVPTFPFVLSLFFPSFHLFLSYVRSFF
jgi:hypothetical protein